MATPDMSGGIFFSSNNADMRVGRDYGSNNIVNLTTNYAWEDPRSATNIAGWLRSPSINYQFIQEETHTLMTPGTIRWLFDSLEYTAWVQDDKDAPRKLQCLGMPGAGKTVLVSAVIDDLEDRFSSQRDSHVVLYIYFKHDRRGIQTRPIVLANLLSQLVQRRQQPSDLVLQFFDKYSHARTLVPGPEKTLPLLKSEITTYAKAFIVVDALDEFSDLDSMTSELLYDLEGLKAQLLITSRVDIPFKPTTSSRIHVSADKADMEAFIEGRISSHTRLTRFIERNPLLKKEIVDSICAKSHGMFLIARFLMDWLSELLTPNDIRDELHKLPTGLHGMYSLTMGRMRSQTGSKKKLAFFVLSWLLLSKRRLKMDELRCAVSFELRGGSVMVSDDDLLEIDDIFSACAGLVICEGDEVQFVHFSTKEFLEKHCDEYLPDAKLWVMETCLRYLIALVPSIPDDLRVASDPYKKAEGYFRPFPFAEYASSQWGFHAFDADGHERLNYQLVDEFFRHPISPYLPSYNFPSPRIKQTREMSTMAYKTLFFATFGLCSLLKRCIEGMRNQGGGTTGVDLNARDKEGWAPISFATAHNHSTMVKLLAENGADTSPRDNGHRTPLHYAAYNGLTDMITTLLDRGSSINAMDDKSQTAVFNAVEGDKLGAVKLLIVKGANIRLRNTRGETLLHQAVCWGLSEIATILLENGLDINSVGEDGYSPIWVAVEAGRPEMVRFLIEKGAYIDKPDGRGHTLLHRAAYLGRAEIVTILLEKGMDINSVNADGIPPLLSAFNGRNAVAKLLIEKGADISVQDRLGQTVLHRAACWGLSEIVTLLLEKGMDINTLDQGERPPIWIAAEERKWDMMRLLIEKGADINLRGMSGRTLLHRAAYWGRSEIATLLLEKGIDVNSVDDEGRSPVWIAVEELEGEMVKLLIERGADVDIPSKSGQTALHRAAYRGRCDIAVALLEKGTDIDCIDGDGRTPVSIATDARKPEMVKLLIERGASVDIPSEGAETLL